MKIWRGISLTLWSIVLMTLLLVSSVHYLLTMTVLDQTKATNALKQTGFYSAVRGDVLLPQILDQAAGQTGGAVLQAKDVEGVVNNVFTQDKVSKVTDDILGATYQWLDKKTPRIEFSIPVANEKQAILTGLDARIRQNVAALPACENFADVSDDVATLTCLPPFTSRDQVSAEAMSRVTDQFKEVDETLTPETVGLTSQNMRGAINTPDYLSYLWAANLITLPLALIITLYLLLKRRAAGLMAVGASLFVLGALGFVAYGGLHSPSLLISNNALDREIIVASQKLIEPVLLLGSGAGMVAGAAAIVSGIFWHRARREK